MSKWYTRLKEGQYTYSNQFANLETTIFVIFREALEFEATVPQLCTFHMDLHPPTHTQL